MADNKSNFFSKLKGATEVALERYMTKARSEIAEEEDDAFYRKSIYRDLNYQVSSQGYVDRGTKIGFMHLRQMAMKDTIVAMVIQTYQNKVAKHSKLVKEKHEVGFRIVLKDEDLFLEQVKEEIFGAGDREAGDGTNPDTEDKSAEIQHTIETKTASEEPVSAENIKDAEEEKDIEHEDEHSMSEREKDRIAREELRKRTQKKARAIAQYIENCGYMEDRPFESRRWNFDSWLRATVRDSLTYDQYASEFVPDQKGDIHHFVPVDGATIRLTTPEFAQYQNENFMTGYDILYPEKELEALKETDAFELDPEKLKNFDYKYVQIARNRIQRAFTPDELAMGMRNITTDIYSNGYPISELELLVGVVSSHIFTENYNHSYFSQGFSAKGILHIKAPLNRRKLETIRLQWRHMITGSRNSFQTPIMSGMDEIKWIPLTQSHSDMEFSNWMNYLIKVICGIYQIDPAEIGFGMREEGGRGGGLQGGQNLEAKLDHSRSKGLEPLLVHLATYLNQNIIDRIDADFKLEFTGIGTEAPADLVNRQKEEVKFKKSINEIRAEDGLPPIPGADDLILEPTYFQWFTQFHPEGKKAREEGSLMGQLAPPPPPPPGSDNPSGGAQPGPEDSEPTAESHVAEGLETQSDGLGKSIKVEYLDSKE
jgi:Phage portal protein